MPPATSSPAYLPAPRPDARRADNQRPAAIHRYAGTSLEMTLFGQLVLDAMPRAQ